VRFLEDPYTYSSAEEADDKSGWFKGIISGGKPSAGDDKE
jgi:hypothetical protein